MLVVPVLHHADALPRKLLRNLVEFRSQPQDQLKNPPVLLNGERVRVRFRLLDDQAHLEPVLLHVNQRLRRGALLFLMVCILDFLRRPPPVGRPFRSLLQPHFFDVFRQVASAGERI